MPGSCPAGRERRREREEKERTKILEGQHGRRKGATGRHIRDLKEEPKAYECEGKGERKEGGRRKGGGREGGRGGGGERKEDGRGFREEIGDRKWETADEER